MRGLALYLRLVNFALGFDKIPGDLRAADVERMRRGNMQSDIFHELAEVFISRHEISLAIHLDEHTDFSLQMNVGRSDAFLCRAHSFFRSDGDAFSAQNRFGLFEVADAFDKSTIFLPSMYTSSSGVSYAGGSPWIAQCDAG